MVFVKNEQLIRMTTNIEEQIVGTVLQYPDLLQDPPIPLQPAWFSNARLGRIVALMQQMQQDGRSVDMLLLYHECQQHHYTDIDLVGLSQLAAAVTSTTHFTDYLYLLHSQWMQRQAAQIGAQLQVPGDKPVEEAIQQAEDALYALGDSSITTDTIPIAADIDATQHRIIEASASQKALIGISSGFDNLDKKLLGFQPTDLLILAARPSQGKTALGVSFARLIAKQHIPVAFFSLEMGREQIINRLLMQESGLAGEVVRSGVMTEFDKNTALNTSDTMRAWPIWLDDTPSLSVQMLRQKSRKLVRKQGVRVIIVDYLQLLTTTAVNRTSTRENEVSAISRALKCLAKELHVPIIALAQLNREPERAAEVREPRLSDLRESGAIEQDADIVMMLHKPKTATNDERELIIAKHRNGATGSVLLHFHAPTASFN